MLLVMTSEAYRKCILTQTIPKKKHILYNYNSLYKCDSVGMNEIFPFGGNAEMYHISNTNQKDFDVVYANFLMGDESAFNSMLMMMYNLYNGYDIIILIGTYMSDPAQMVLDSYLKFIQQRYGTLANYVYDETDFEALDESQRIFSYQGLFYWDEDKKKATQLIMDFASENPKFRDQLIDSMEKSEAKL